MATKKRPSSRSTPTPKPQPPAQRLQNLAARPSYNDMLDEQLVDHSGVFRVTSAIAQAQVGHSEDANPRFPNDSLAMAAQRDGFPDEPTVDDPLDEKVIDDEAQQVDKRARLATLVARNAARTRSRR